MRLNPKIIECCFKNCLVYDSFMLINLNKFIFSNISIEKLDVMCCMGLYINDLSMHDSSRDLVLAGTQQSAELRLALDQVRHKNDTA